MPRSARRLVVVPDHPHHIILRGNNRRRIFSFKSDYRFFLLRMARASRENQVPVHCSVLMRNHVHLIATPPTCTSLSRFVRVLAQSYAQYRNRKRESTGKLFEERYKCIPISSEEQMAITMAYIEMNPVRAGLCRSPADYEWSTFRLHTGHGRVDPSLERVWTPSSWFLSLAEDPTNRQLAYEDWFEHYRRRDDWSEVAKDPARKQDRRRVARPDGSNAA
jgi:putative transposase